jgi:hypothetical protein
MTGFVDDRRYVDLKTFRRIFGFSKTRVYGLVNSGKLTKLKLGGRSRFIVEEGEAYMRSLDAGRRPPPKPSAPVNRKGRTRRT